jgi:hypothetical protein
MKIVYIFLAAIILVSCSNNEQKNQQNSENKRNEKLCFLSTDGLKNEDSTSLNIHIQDTLVTGEYNYIPYEKDAAIETISGVIKDSIIECVYTYSQEGEEFKENQTWKIRDNQILLKTAPAIIDEQGNIVYDSSKFEFNIILNKIDCKPSNQ